MIVDLIPRIAAEEAKREGDRGAWRPRCSSAGTERCIRAEVYRSLGQSAAPLPGRTVLVFDDGDWHEELTLNWLRKSAFTVHSEQMAVSPCFVPGSHRGYKCSVCEQDVEEDAVHGHIDAIVTDPMGVDYVLEHKSASRFSFARWATGHEIPWDYVTQAAFYVYGSRQIGTDVDRRAIIVIKNKDTSAYLEIVVLCPTKIGPGEEPTVVESITVMEGEKRVDVAVIEEHRERKGLLQAAVDRWTDIVRHRDTKHLPDRPFAFGFWRCDWCMFARTCWDGYIESASNPAASRPVALTGEDADLARACAAASANAAAAEKVAKQLKEEMKVRLMALGARSATCADDDQVYSVGLAMRSRKGIDKEKIPDAVMERAETISHFEVLSVKAKPKEQ
jgi:hypothetical protein